MHHTFRMNEDKEGEGKSLQNIIHRNKKKNCNLDTRRGVKWNVRKFIILHLIAKNPTLAIVAVLVSCSEIFDVIFYSLYSQIIFAFFFLIFIFFTTSWISIQISECHKINSNCLVEWKRTWSWKFLIYQTINHFNIFFFATKRIYLFLHLHYFFSVEPQIPNTESRMPKTYVCHTHWLLIIIILKG